MSPTAPATTPAELADFRDFAMAQIALGESASFMQLAKRWNDERELEAFVRETMESNRQFEQGLGRPIEELHAAMRAKIAAMRELASATEAAP